MNLHVARAIREERSELEQVVRACGPQVRDYFEMRNLDDYWNNGFVWKARWLRGEAIQAIIAFAVINVLKREPVISLYDIGVHPVWRGLGVATKLMQGVWMAYPDREELRLVVNEDNKDAILVYQRWGLEIVERKATRRHGFVYKMRGRPWRT
jgi:ribosomal protein S18 acetylase RimI-like enzyme